MLSKDTIKRGLVHGFSVVFVLAKTIIPIYFVITFLEHTPVMELLAKGLTPYMSVLGLPGEAAIALVLGFLLNIYAALGAIVSLDLTLKQINIIATILLVAHSLPLETAVSQSTGIKAWPLIVVRLGVAFTAGSLINLIW